MTGKKLWLIVLIMVSSALLLSGDVVEEIVAIVNGDVITLSEYREQFNSMVKMLRAQLSGEQYFKEYERLKESLLDMMITDLLLLQKAREQNLNVKEQLKATIERIKEDNHISSDEELIRAMAAQGIDYNVWVKELEENLLRQAVIYMEVDRTIALDDAEIVSYYKKKPEEFVVPPEYRIKALYLASATNPEYQLEEKRKTISEKLMNGVAFEELVAEFSEGPKENGGDLGFFKKGELEKAIEEAVEKLKPGEVSPWIQARNGWYLVKLEEKKESYQKTFDQARQEIEQKLYMQKREQKINEYVKKLKEESYIKILNPNPLNL
ncbi:MAG: peptidyl-prolyl cis-trans isomerase [Candidatus Saccharicenans sp.]|nr:peptidyl-prolyl cis-trans isomerase [Candidatus Saccharicenans sp.]